MYSFFFNAFYSSFVIHGLSTHFCFLFYSFFFKGQRSSSIELNTIRNVIGRLGMQYHNTGRNTPLFQHVFILKDNMTSVLKPLHSTRYYTHRVSNPDVSTQRRDFRVPVKAAFSLSPLSSPERSNKPFARRPTALSARTSGRMRKIPEGNPKCPTPGTFTPPPPPPTSRCAGEDKAQPPPLT